MTINVPARPLRRVVLGITGGIAAYKAAELTRLLVKEGIAVDVVMTRAATQFIAPMTLQALSGNPVLTDLWDSGAANAMGHIELSRHADAIIVAPASADFIAKLAHGAADDLLSTLCLARDCGLLVAPAMNRQMWAAPATQRNAAQIRADGVEILGPGSGDQACGEIGDGRMLEAEEILAALIAWAQPKHLDWQTRVDYRRTDLRGDRPGARHYQLELGQDGLCPGAGMRRGGRGGDDGRRADDARDARGRDAGQRDQRRGHGGCGRRAYRVCRHFHRGRGRRGLYARRCAAHPRSRSRTRR